MTDRLDAEGVEVGEGVQMAATPDPQDVDNAAIEEATQAEFDVDAAEAGAPAQGTAV